MKERLIFLDKITPLSFIAILFLQFKYSRLKIICGSLLSQRFIFKLLENYLLRHTDIRFIFYDHLNLHGINIPEVLINHFGELKDNINERVYLCCEKLFNDKIVQSKIYKAILNFVNNDIRINNFLKKELMLHYCRRYIGLFECVNFLVSKSAEEFKLFSILTGDSLDLWKIYCHEFGNFNPPPKILLKKLFNFLDWLKCVLVAPVILIFILYQYLKRLSFRIKKYKNAKKRIWIESGVGSGFLKNFFRETSPFKSSFSLEETIFITDDTGIKELEDYSSKYGIKIDVVSPQSTPIDIPYFFKRVVLEICYLFLVKQLLLSFKIERKLILWRITYSLMKRIVDYESLCRLYPVKLFLILRYYQSTNAVKTIVLNRCGAKTASLQFGDIVHPMFQVFLYTYATANHFFLYGEEGTKEFQKAGHLIDKFHAIGSYLVDASIQLESEREAVRNKFNLNGAFVITVFGPAYNETIPRRKNVLKFYQAVFSAFQEIIERDIILVIKVHKKSDMVDEESDFPELAELINLYRHHKKVRYYYYENPYELIVASDFVITWSASTTGIESIAAGKRTIFFDPMKSRFHTYRNYDANLVISDAEQLKILFRAALNGNFPVRDDVYENIRVRHCYPNDGQAMQRILDKLYNVIIADS